MLIAVSNAVKINFQEFDRFILVWAVWGKGSGAENLQRKSAVSQTWQRLLPSRPLLYILRDSDDKTIVLNPGDGSKHSTNGLDLGTFSKALIILSCSFCFVIRRNQKATKIKIMGKKPISPPPGAEGSPEGAIASA